MSIPINDRRQLAAAGALLLLLAASACSKSEPAAERETVNAPTTIAAVSTVPMTRAVAGMVRSATVSPLSAKVMGNVIRVHVSEGDSVRAGQLLLEIDPREGRAQVEMARAGRDQADQAIAAARANATLAETTFKRYAALRERGSVSQQEYDDMKARRDAAAAGLQGMMAQRAQASAASTQAQTFSDYAQVRSPIDGVITARMVDPGAQAAPGMPLLTVEDTRAYRVEATVPEDLAVSSGDPVKIESGGEVIDARVTHLQPVFDANSRGALVKIDLPRPLRSGSYVRVLFSTGERKAIVVPAASIVRRGALTSVFVVGMDSVARMRLITLGERNEVLSGLDPGERLVTDATRVRDGVKISSTVTTAERSRS